jgi:hypothetical protein
MMTTNRRSVAPACARRDGLRNAGHAPGDGAIWPHTASSAQPIDCRHQFDVHCRQIDLVGLRIRPTPGPPRRAPSPAGGPPLPRPSPSSTRMAAMEFFNRDPLVHTWIYKLDKAALKSSEESLPRRSPRVQAFARGRAICRASRRPLLWKT